MKIAVLGAGGFIGSALVRELRDAGHSVGAFTRKEGDLRTLALLPTLKHFLPELVINCAAQTAGIVGQGDTPADIIHENLLIHSNAPQLAVLSGASLYMNLLTSSTYPSKSKPLNPRDIEDGLPHISVEPFSAAKRASLAVARAYAKQYKLKTVHVVPTGVYGIGDNFSKSGKVMASLIKKFVDAEKSGAETVEVLGSGSPVRDWTYVDDIARWMSESILIFPRIGCLEQPIVHLTSGDSAISVMGLTKIIKEESGFSGEVVFNHAFPDGAMYKVLSVTYPFSKTISLQDGIRKTITWLRQS